MCFCVTAGICLVVVLIVALAFVLVSRDVGSSEPIYVDSEGNVVAKPVAAEEEPDPVSTPGGVQTGRCGAHVWCCDFVEHPILIDSDLNTVKLGPKKFNADEVLLLKTINSNNVKSTWDIFVEIDTKTKSCKNYKIGGKFYLNSHTLSRNRRHFF